MKCSLCPKRCNATRTDRGNTGGVCKMPLLPRVARAALHFWEEPCISGSRGSGTVFFSGCSLGCVYCQNSVISHGGYGKTVTPERLAEIFRELEQAGAHNINLVNPTHYVHAVRRALSLYRPQVPIVYNSGGYDSVEALRQLQPLIDVYLMDFKYDSPARAAKYSAAEDYPQVARAALLECIRQQPECVFDREGILRRGVIVRHLILPQGTADAIAVFDWVRENLPGAYFSIMSQYTPCAQAADDRVLNRPITKREYDKVLSHICDSGFTHCYMQQRGSADTEYIPPFDLTGVSSQKKD